MTAKPRKPLLVNVLSCAGLAVMLPIVYVLSYAPACRFIGPMVPIPVAQPNRGGLDRQIRTSISSYNAVEWLIDETPLREPLFCGAV